MSKLKKITEQETTILRMRGEITMLQAKLAAERAKSRALRAEIRGTKS